MTATAASQGTIIMASFSTTTEPSSRAAAQADVTNVIAESSLLDGTGQIIDFPASPPSLGDVLSLPPQELSRFSLDFLNLLCASGLPDTADLNIDACLKTLAGWTEHVRQETERNLGRFHRDPEPYRHSEAYYRVLMMVTVLQQDCGVRYDPDCIKSPLFLNSGEGFLHGLLAGQANGTCPICPCSMRPSVAAWAILSTCAWRDATSSAAGRPRTCGSGSTSRAAAWGSRRRRTTTT